MASPEVVEEEPSTPSGTTKEFIIRYETTTYTYVSVERDANITEKELLDSITRTELDAGSYEDDGVWDQLKEAWRSAEPGMFSITDDDYNEQFSY